MKICNTCGNEKPLSDFSKDKSTHGGLRNRCRKCMSAIYKAHYAANQEYHKQRSREWGIKNPVKRRRAGKNCELRKLYGISLSQYEEMIAQQSGKCKICDLLMPLPYVDHCHVTGKVRGLLCAGCNTGLGGFRDSPRLLHRAVGYLDPGDGFCGDAGC